MLARSHGPVDDVLITGGVQRWSVAAELPFGREVVRPSECRGRPDVARFPVVLHHREVVDFRLCADIALTPLEVVIEEAKQLAVVVEVRLRRATERIDAPAAAMVPRTKNQSAAGCRDSEKALDRRMRVGAVEPSAVAVDGGA